MQMTESEIVRNYKGAANKESQLHVLADLNCTDTKTIREILIQNGIPESELPKLRKGRPKGEARPAKKKQMKKPPVMEEPIVPDTLKQKCFRAPESTRDSRKLAPVGVPDAVLMICQSRLELLTDKIIGIEKEMEHLKQLSMEYEKERDVLADYLRGVAVDG